MSAELNSFEINVNKCCTQARWAQTCPALHWFWLIVFPFSFKSLAVWSNRLQVGFYQWCIPAWIIKSHFMHRTILEHRWMKRLKDISSVDKQIQMACKSESMLGSCVIVIHRREFFQSSTSPKFVFAFEEGAYLIYSVIPRSPSEVISNHSVELIGSSSRTLCYT